VKTNKTLAQKLCLLGLESLLSYTAALLAALCFLVLLPGCSLGEKVDREPVQTLECTRLASLSGLYPAGGSVVLISWADYESGRTTVQLVDAEADTVKREVTLDGVWDTKRQALAHGFALCDREAKRTRWRVTKRAAEQNSRKSSKMVACGCLTLKSMVMGAHPLTARFLRFPQCGHPSSERSCHSVRQSKGRA